jgi:cyclohexadienyl dehydratase
MSFSPTVIFWFVWFGLALTGCAERAVSPQPASVSSLLVGLSGDYPPFCQMHGAGKGWQGYFGFDAELLRKLEADLGWSLRPARFEWPLLASAMTEGRYDLAACGVTVRPDRATSMLFSRPYATSGAVAVIRAEAGTRPATLDDLNQPGVRIGVNAGGHLERVTRQRFGRATIQTLADNRQLSGLLESGAVDAVISDVHEAARWPNVKTLGPFTQDLKALALPLDHLHEREAVNAWLAGLEANGWLSAQRRRLGVVDAELTPAGYCVASLASAIELRFALMPMVAAVKLRDGLPINDPRQEARVLDQVRAKARGLGLAEQAAVELFRVLMEDAKRIQARNPMPPSTVNGLDLARLRSAVAGASDAVLPEIGRCQPLLRGRQSSMTDALAARLGQWLRPDELAALAQYLPPLQDFSRIQP